MKKVNVAPPLPVRTPRHWDAVQGHTASEQGDPEPQPTGAASRAGSRKRILPERLELSGSGAENDYILSVERHGRCLEAAAAPRGSDGGRLCGSVQDEPTFCQEPLMTDSKSLD